MQCYSCQRIGHTAYGCRSKIRCMVCSNEHVKEVYRAIEELCAKCGGKDKANTKLCNYIKNAAEYEKERAYQSGKMDVINKVWHLPCKTIGWLHQNTGQIWQ